MIIIIYTLNPTDKKVDGSKSTKSVPVSKHHKSTPKAEGPRVNSEKAINGLGKNGTSMNVESKQVRSTNRTSTVAKKQASSSQTSTTSQSKVKKANKIIGKSTSKEPSKHKQSVKVKASGAKNDPYSAQDSYTTSINVPSIDVEKANMNRAKHQECQDGPKLCNPKMKQSKKKDNTK